MPGGDEIVKSSFLIRSGKGTGVLDAAGIHARAEPFSKCILRRFYDTR